MSPTTMGYFPIPERYEVIIWCRRSLCQEDCGDVIPDLLWQGDLATCRCEPSPFVWL